VRAWSSIVIAGLVAAGGSIASAQDASSVGAAVQPGQMRARFQIAAMEGVLETAVQLGARRLSQQVQAVSPDMLFIAGAARARGFWLEGYGVFFDVDVPAMRRSVAWQFRSLDRGDRAAAAAIQSIRHKLAAVSDPQARREIEEGLRRLERTVGPVQLPAGATAPQASAAGGSTRVSSAQTVTPGVVESPATSSAEDRPTEDRPTDAGTPAVLDDPGRAYTNEVQSALVDAMLDFGPPIPVADGEWLTIAARDNDDSRLGGGDPYDVSTILLRIRGADLAAYRAKQITREDAVKRVEIREY
jgi:hypothetical protein